MNRRLKYEEEWTDVRIDICVCRLSVESSRSVSIHVFFAINHCLTATRLHKSYIS